MVQSYGGLPSWDACSPVRSISKAVLLCLAVLPKSSSFKQPRSFADHVERNLKALEQTVARYVGYDGSSLPPHRQEIKLPVQFNGTYSVTHEGMERTYSVLLPSGTVQNPPVLIMYHGSGSDGAAFASEGDMASKAIAEGFLMAYLDGVPSPESQAQSKHRKWNSGSAASQKEALLFDDVGFTSKVIEDLVGKYNIDRKRVYAAGISNGGSMALRFACERADLLAGVASVHGSLETSRADKCASNCSKSGYCTWDTNKEGCGAESWYEDQPPAYTCDSINSRRVPAIFFNGKEDYWTAPEGSIWLPPKSLRGDGTYDTRAEIYPPAEFMYGHFARAYGCSEVQPESFLNVTDGTPSTTCQTYTGCNANVNVTHCMVQAGHWWYGAPYDVEAPCLYKGYTEKQCRPEKQFLTYGNSTDSVDVTNEILVFFGSM